MATIEKGSLAGGDEALGQADRRTFLQRAALALLVGPAAGSALLVGCSGTSGLDPGLAALLVRIRQIFGQVLDDAEGTNLPTRAQWEAWLGQLNQQSAQCQDAARTASVAEIRANYDPAMQEVTDWLEQQSIPPDFSDPWQPYIETELRNAWLRADLLLVARPPADRRALWAFVLGLALLAGSATNQELLDTADQLRAQDTTDVAGRIYDAVFGVQVSGAEAPANLANRALLFNLLPLLVTLLYVGLGARAARNLGILLNTHPQVLFILAIYLMFFFPT